MTNHARLLALLLTVLLSVAACATEFDDAADETSSADDSDEFADTDCTQEGLGGGDEFDFTVAHPVVDGELGEPCLGESDPILNQAWDDLATITPAFQLNDLGYFGGFEANGDSDETTFAFVNTIDEEGSSFQMSVNLSAYADDADEGLLTMAHEFTHVFTATESQIDRSVFDAGDCDTYYNGEGCYYEDAIMAEWVRLFWANGLIDEVDPNADASVADGEERCADNPGFFGFYAASNPEEDFAETFSAYVYRLKADNDEQQAKLDWIDAQPGLAEFQDRAVAAGQGPLLNGFEYCGQ